MREPQGLVASLSLYLAALAAGLLLFAGPIYWLNSGTTLANPGVAAYDPPPGATLIRTRDPHIMPLAVLDHKDIVDSTQLAAISAKTKRAERTEPHAARRERSADSRYALEPAHRGGFFFGLF